MQLAAVATLALLASMTVASAQETANEQDVVVIARRMRLVRLDYALNGPHLRRCDVEVSSGDARVDRTMCTVLKRCVMAGYREPQPAKLCMDASVSMFASGERSPPDPDKESALAAVKEARAIPSPNQAYPPPSEDKPSDIVVESSRNKPSSGEWQFTKLRSSGRGRLAQSQWKLCIPDRDVQSMLRIMLDGGERQSASGRCGSMKIKFWRGRIEGNRTCLNRRARMKTLIHGRVDQDRISIEETTYLVESINQRSDYAISVPEDDSVARLAGQRIGECSATSEAEEH